MKQLILLSALILQSVFAAVAQTADPFATPQTQCILQYISSLPSQQDNKVISGQWMHNRGLPQTPQTEFDTAITTIYNQSAQWVGAIGTNYMRDLGWPNTAITNHVSVNQPLIDYFQQGGLVNVMVHWKNPWSGGFQQDTTGASNLLDLITNGNPAHTQFLNDLDSIAIGFQQLQDSGVTVIFRPLHEQNGYWFWWGNRPTHSPSDYAAVWQYIFNYFTVTKQLHNILWMYSATVKETTSGPGTKPELYYYPGSSYVDIIGVDQYNDTLDIPNYNALVATGKPVGLAEFGPKKNTVLNTKFVYDYTTLINQLRTKYPLFCFWNAWNHFCTGNNCIYYSMSTQNNSSALLSDTWVANRSDIDYSSCLATGVNETNSAAAISIFPNPTSGKFTLILTGQDAAHNSCIEIYNITGEKIYTAPLINTASVIDLSNYGKGLYFIKVITVDKQFVQKIIVE